VSIHSTAPSSSSFFSPFVKSLEFELNCKSISVLIPLPVTAPPTRVYPHRPGVPRNVTGHTPSRAPSSPGGSAYASGRGMDIPGTGLRLLTPPWGLLRPHGLSGVPRLRPRGHCHRLRHPWGPVDGWDEVAAPRPRLIRHGSQPPPHRTCRIWGACAVPVGPLRKRKRSRDPTGYSNSSRRAPPRNTSEWPCRPPTSRPSDPVRHGWPYRHGIARQLRDAESFPRQRDVR